MPFREEVIATPDIRTGSWHAGFLAGVFDAEGSHSRGVLRISNKSPLILGLIADALGLPVAMWVVAGITFVSGAVVAVRMTETLKRTNPSPGLDRVR